MIDELTIARWTGQLAIALLAASLFASLSAKTRPLRRTLGLCAFAAGAAHATYVIASPLVEDLSHVLYEPHLRAGATTLLILAILAATSFPERFKVREWKALHRFVYAAALLALHHVSLASHATKLALLVPGSAIALALIFRTVRAGGLSRFARTRRGSP